MPVAYLPSFSPSGDFSKMPLPVLFAHLLQEKKTGMLRLRFEERDAWIYFEDGFPACANIPKSQPYFGQILRELGIIDDDVYNRSLLEMATTKKLQGQVLMDMGKISGDQLERALALQLNRKLVRLFSLRSGPYTFGEGEELPFPFQPTRVNPFSLIAHGIRNSYSNDDLKHVLGGLVGKSCRTLPTFEKRREMFELADNELEYLAKLAEYRSPQEFVRLFPAGPIRGMMVLYTLLVCQLLEMGNPEQATALPPPPPTETSPEPSDSENSDEFITTTVGRRTKNLTLSASPGADGESSAGEDWPNTSSGVRKLARSQGEAPEITGDSSVSQRSQGTGSGLLLRELRQKIDKKFSEAQRSDFFALLEVDREADTASVRKKFNELVKAFHPDRMPEDIRRDCGDKLDVIVSLLNEAHEILTNAKRRQEYIENPRSVNTQRAASRMKEAKVHYQKAMVFLKKKEWANARQSFGWAHDMDPFNSDYLVHLQWMEYLQGDEDDTESIEKTKTGLIEIIKTNAHCFLAFRFLAQLFKKQNDQERYLNCLLRAQKLNPKDVEVAREVRLHKMRQDKDKASGKLFGMKIK